MKQRWQAWTTSGNHIKVIHNSYAWVGRDGKGPKQFQSILQNSVILAIDININACVRYSPCLGYIFFILHPLLLGYETCNHWKMMQQIQTMLVTNSPIIYGTRLNILFIIKVKILVFIQQSCRVPPPKIMLFIEPQMVNIF